MKGSLSLLAAGVVAVHAQASLPQCGQTCVNNMLQIAVSQFGCDANDLASCACCNADFGFGIRDCSQEVCGDGSADYSSVISYGSSYCASAVTSCPGSSIPATSVIATATGAANATMSSSIPAMTSGPLAGAVGAISPVSGSPDAYQVGQSTLTAGGSVYSSAGTVYTALPNSGGVLVSGGNTETTYVPGAVGGAGNSTMTSMAAGGGGAGALGLAAAASDVSTISGSTDAYVIDGSNTISAGGNQYGSDGTVYSALPSGRGVLIRAGGTSIIANPAASATTTGGGAGGASSSSSGGSSGSTGGSGGGAANQSGGSGSDSDSSSSGNFAPIQTAAPALIGGLAMAVLAF